MLVAFLTDIHSNREALQECLNHASSFGVERYVFLGDYVGYGADPNWVVDKVQEYVSKGASAILGNHDAAVSNLHDRMTETADIAIQWTRKVLGPTQKQFLKNLPLKIEEGSRLYVHANAHSPESWGYISNAASARQSFDATSHRYIFCGHIHVPQLYRMTATSKVVEFTPVSGSPISLSPMWRWLAVIGSVGQPRDWVPAASYTLLDDVTNTITYVRVPYDAETAAQKIRAAGLPDILSLRLLRGR
jgi:diadenosine tetraphosphatase ApaH/serine/threonine PP2A family protein phosphatase